MNARRLFLEIECVGSGGLHFEGYFVGLDAGLEVGIFLQILGVEFVELMN